MSDHAVPTAIDAPSQKQGRSRIGRLLPRYGMATVAAGLAVTILTATAASAAEPLTNGPTIQLGTYNNIPASAPAYQNSPDWAEDPAGLFPVNNGALGNAVNMFMTGESGDYTSNNTYALGIPGGSTTWGTQVLPATLNGNGSAAFGDYRSARLGGAVVRNFWGVAIATLCGKPSLAFVATAPAAGRPSRRRGWCRVAREVGLVQVRVSSAMAFLAQVSSTRPLPSAAAAISAAVAALLSARGRPLA